MTFIDLIAIFLGAAFGAYVGYAVAAYQTVKHLQKKYDKTEDKTE